MTTYVVTGAFINVKTMTRDGMRVIGLMKDSHLPNDVDPVHIQHLLTVGLIAPLPEPEPTVEPPKTPARSVPSRTKVSDAD
jgi:hypothetical protein